MRQDREVTTREACSRLRRARAVYHGTRPFLLVFDIWRHLALIVSAGWCSTSWCSTSGGGPAGHPVPLPQNSNKIQLPCAFHDHFYITFDPAHRLVQRLAEEDPPAFLCHFYNIYFAHSAGGRMIGKKVSETVLDGAELQFYKYRGDLKDLLNRVRVF